MCAHEPEYLRIVVEPCVWCRACGALRLSGDQEWLTHYNHEFARRVIARWGLVQDLIRACQAKLRGAAEEGTALAERFDEIVKSIGGSP